MLKLALFQSVIIHLFCINHYGVLHFLSGFLGALCFITFGLLNLNSFELCSEN